MTATPRFTFACALLLACASASVASAQNPAVTVAVDAAADQKPISPLIYGVNHADTATLADLRAPLNRWGGNNTSRYNWAQNADNRGRDWFFQSVPLGDATPGGSADEFIAASRLGAAEPMMTIPMVGWVGKLGASRTKLASFSIAKYGPQQYNDWQWFPDAGNGVKTDGTYVVGNDPNDASVPASSSFHQGWLDHLVTEWGGAAAGGLKYYILDNEPSIWHDTHRDVHPTGANMEEIRNKIIDYAARVKATDPSGLVVAPEEWGWSGYLYSGYDLQWGSEHGWGSPLPDRTAHGGADYVPWVLGQLRQHDLANGTKSIDVFSLHYYPQSGEYSGDTSSWMQQMRNRSTRSLWDPTYVDESWIEDTVRLIPRMKEWVAAQYPGLPIAITEYSWGADEHVNGATAQADVYGIFGREGVDMATRWGTPPAGSPAYNAMKLFRNHDGTGQSFGNVSVRATVPQPDDLSGFAARRTSDGALTVMVVSKVLTGNTPLTLSLASFAAAGPVHGWRVAATGGITALPSAALSGTTLSTTVPPQSITLYVIPPAPATAALTVGDVTALEGAGTAVFSVVLSPAAASVVTVGFATADGSAKAGQDYTTTSGSLSFSAGQTLKTVSVPLVGDTLDEANETLTLTLSTPAGASIADGVGRATVTDDDTSPTLSFSGGPLADGDRSVTEGDSAATNATFAVTLSAVSGRTVRVNFATGASGTAASGTDYTAKTGQLTFAAGDTVKTFVIQVLPDTAEETNETFFVNLSSPSAATVLDGQSQATIVDNDPAPPGSPTVSVSDTTAAEGSSAVFTITLSAASANTVTVPYATGTGGTAVSGVDYVAKRGTLTFTPGQTTKTIAVSVLADATPEPAETFYLNLTSAAFATIADGQAKAVVRDLAEVNSAEVP